MASQKTKATITYAKPGTRPPIYLAGSFSNPAWQLQEMLYTTKENDEFEFYKEYEIESGKEYQYKFRVGEGNWWLLNEDAPTGTDNVGNRNNILHVPAIPTGEVTGQGGDSKVANGQEPAPFNKTQPKLTSEYKEIMASNPEQRNNPTENAPAGQGKTLGPQDAEISRKDSRTPELAAVAAEYADVASGLDREQATPPISDAEAGRIGLRRLSTTPIPEVANTAAEVADVASRLDEDKMPKLDMPPIFSFDDAEQPDSDAATPWDEKVPQFTHECLDLPSIEPSYQRSPVEPTKSNEEATSDYGDPIIEDFPCDRTSILQRVRTMQTSLSEDQTVVDGVPPSPVVSGRDRRPDSQVDLPKPSPVFIADHRSPSLISISEEQEHKEKLTFLPSPLPSPSNLTLSNGSGGAEFDRDPSSDAEREARKEQQSEPSIDVQEVNPSPSSERVQESAETVALAFEPATPSSIGKSHIGKDEDKEAIREVPMNEGPSIQVEPATPSTKATNNPFTESLDKGKTTAYEKENGQSQLAARKNQASPFLERPLTPSSMHSASNDAKKSKGFLKAFWRVVFVDWIGGLIMRLCGGGRHTLLAVCTLILVTVAPALYFSH